MKLESKVFRDAANIYLWDGDGNEQKALGCCYAIKRATVQHSCLHSGYNDFFKKHFKPKFSRVDSPSFWWKVGWRFWTKAAVQRHRKKMLLKAADLVDKMNGEGV